MSLYSTKFYQFYRFIGAGKFLFGFFYRFISDKNFGEQNCIAFFDFFSKIVYLYRFKRYIFEYHCPPLSIASKYSQTANFFICYSKVFINSSANFFICCFKVFTNISAYICICCFKVFTNSSLFHHLLLEGFHQYLS